MSYFLHGNQQDAARQIKLRLQLFRLGFIFVFIVILLRSFQLIIFPPEFERFNPKSSSEYLDYPRGDVKDRNGALLATSLKLSSLYVDPAILEEDKEKMAKNIVSIFPDLDEAWVLRRLNQKNRFAWIKRHITPEEMAAVNALGIPALNFMDEYDRVYPQGDIMSHIVGAVNVDGVGTGGVENVFNKELKDSDKSIKLTLDMRIQTIVAEEVQKQIDAFDAIGGAGMVVDANTGDVLAAVSLPSYNPNKSGNPNNNNRFNRLFRGVYEMGSSFKIFSAAALLEKKDPPLSKSYDATKPLRRAGFTIHDYHGEKRVMTIPDIFLHSSNIGTALMAEDAGEEAIKGTYNKFGFFDRLDTDLGQTVEPLVPEPWQPISTVTTSYGHGIAVTPIHVVNAMLQILNPDKQTSLRFVKNKELQTRHKNKANVVNAKTSESIKRLMRLTVRVGTGRKADVNGYLVAGKTATAEKVSGRGYNEKSLLSSFVSFYPADKPKAIVFVMIDEPIGQKHSYGYATAGWTAAPAIANIIERMTAVNGDVPRDMSKTYDPSEQLIRFLPEKMLKELEKETQ